MRKCLVCLMLCLALGTGQASAHTVMGMDVSDADPPSLVGREACPVLDECNNIGFGPGGLAWDGSYLWIGGGFGNATIYKYDVAACAVVGSFSAPSAGWLDAISGLTHDGTNLWCHPEETGMIYKLDPSDGTVLDSIEAPSFGDADPNGAGLAWDGTNLWHVNSSRNIAYKIDPESGDILDSFNVPSGYSSGLAWWDGNLIVSNISTDAVYVVDPDDGTVLSTCGTPSGHPWGMAPTGAAFWLSGNSVNHIFLLDILGTPVKTESWGTIKALYR
jgi:DNA-binding beta-propeller fold protein YncE